MDGDFSEDMESFSNSLVGAGERAGTYDATVTATGYAAWTSEDIFVTEDECHVIPVSISAELDAL